MTRAVPEWIGKTDNTAIPQRVRDRIYDAAGGCCQGCTRQIFKGERWQIDHRVALVNADGGNRENNLQLLCDWCHKHKTARDVAEKSRTYRKRLKDRGVKKPRTITRWRKMNGDIVIAGRDR